MEEEKKHLDGMGIDGRKRTAHNSEYKGNNLLKMDETYEKTNRRGVIGVLRIRFLVITAEDVNVID